VTDIDPEVFNAGGGSGFWGLEAEVVAVMAVMAVAVEGFEVMAMEISSWSFTLLWGSSPAKESKGLLITRPGYDSTEGLGVVEFSTRFRCVEVQIRRRMIDRQLWRRKGSTPAPETSDNLQQPTK
jgi:hypothetical protein